VHADSGPQLPGWVGHLRITGNPGNAVLAPKRFAQLEGKIDTNSASGELVFHVFGSINSLSGG
jgi:hypothetical protein